MLPTRRLIGLDPGAVAAAIDHLRRLGQREVEQLQASLAQVSAANRALTEQQESLRVELERLETEALRLLLDLESLSAERSAALTGLYQATDSQEQAYADQIAELRRQAEEYRNQRNAIRDQAQRLIQPYVTGA